MRRVAAAVATLALLLPAGAAAHTTSSPVRFASPRGLQPALAGVALEVAPGGGRVTAVNRSARTITVLDAGERPLFRLHPGGRTEQRTAIGWIEKSRDGTVTWHDDRTERIGPAAIAITDERGARSVLAGTVTAARRTQHAPLWPFALVVLAAGAAALGVRRVLR